jgi:hypothetical protein
MSFDALTRNCSIEPGTRSQLNTQSVTNLLFETRRKRAMKESVRDEIPKKSEANRDAVPHGAQGQIQMKMDEARLERIKAVMTEALARVDSTKSVLGAVTSDLMELELRMKKTLDEAFSDTVSAIEKFQQVMPMIQVFMKLTGQIARYVDLQRLLAEPE